MDVCEGTEGMLLLETEVLIVVVLAIEPFIVLLHSLMESVVLSCSLPSFSEGDLGKSSLTGVSAF